MMSAMSIVFAQILGLGKAPSAFGVTLAMILTWVVGLGGLVAVLVWFILGQVKSEHKENLQRAAEFDAKFGAPDAPRDSEN
jgi:hypothetical protein